VPARQVKLLILYLYFTGNYGTWRSSGVQQGKPVPS
jgi:hypothetical protein